MKTIKTQLFHLFLVVLHNLIMKNFLRIIVGIRFSDNSSMKTVPQFLLMSNHNSHLDSPTLYASVPASIIHRVNSAAAHDFYGRNAFMRAIAWCFNSKFIYRTRIPGVPKTLEVMEDILKSGNSIMAFPEGTRGEPGVMAKFKTGLGILLKRNPHIPFIPCYIYGVEESMPRGSKFFIPFNCYINVGKPVYVTAEMTVDQILDLMKEEILKLKLENK